MRQAQAVQYMSKVYTFTNGGFTDKYDHITKGRYVIAADIDGYIYKSYESALGREVPLKDHIKCMIEANAGAHYYAQNAYTEKYSRIKTLVDLNKLKINRRDQEGKPCRNAYICLGYVSGGKCWHIDTGLCNNQEKDVWAAFFCDFGLGQPKEVTFKDIAEFNTDKYPNARYFETEVDISGCTDKKDVVKCVYRFLDENRKILGEIAATCEKEAGEVFTRNNGKPMVRFVRFMSLIPRTGRLEDDDADGTYLDAAMEELILDGLPWTDEYLDYVWSVQEANITNLQISNLGNNPLGNDIDAISIIHNVQVG